MDRYMMDECIFVLERNFENVEINQAQQENKSLREQKRMLRILELMFE